MQNNVLADSKSRLSNVPLSLQQDLANLLQQLTAYETKPRRGILITERLDQTKDVRSGF